MPPSGPRRFDDTELGEPLPPVEISTAGAGPALGAAMRRFVAAWAGSQAAADKVRILKPSSAPTSVVRLGGKVYGRHMDGSRCVEIEVFGSDAEGQDVRAMVRVKLA
jgi:hypothetical protein